jgi:hypothetical protein
MTDLGSVMSWMKNIFSGSPSGSGSGSGSGRNGVDCLTYEALDDEAAAIPIGAEVG